MLVLHNAGEVEREVGIVDHGARLVELRVLQMYRLKVDGPVPVDTNNIFLNKGAYQRQVRTTIHALGCNNDTTNKKYA